MNRGKIIVLEGPDGVGKTTLADAIEAAETDVKVVRFRQGPPPEGVMPALHYMDGVDDIVKSSEDGSTVIVDRFHVGELVYGPILRGESGISSDEAYAIDMRLCGLGAAMIHCFTSQKEMVRRLIARDGGIPDEKSGATVEMSHMIRVSFAHKCGTPERRGFLPTRWSQLELVGYPDQMARKIMAHASVRRVFAYADGIYGNLVTAKTIFLLPEDGEDVDHISWLIGKLRLMGVIDTCVFVTKSAVTEGFRPTVVCDSVVVLGEAIEWVQLNGIEYTSFMNHSVDFQHCDSEDFTAALKIVALGTPEIGEYRSNEGVQTIESEVD
jgi:hypothetical protein